MAQQILHFCDKNWSEITRHEQLAVGRLKDLDPLAGCTAAAGSQVEFSSGPAAAAGGRLARI
jgi:hypothetical protein